MKPEIYVELNLVFDNTYDVNMITRLTGLTPSESCCQTKDRINPLTKRALEGYWTLKSNTYKGFDIQFAVDDILSKISSKIEQIKDICNQNSGEPNFCIVITFKSDNKPAINFDRDFLDIVSDLGATIQLDMYVV